MKQLVTLKRDSVHRINAVSGARCTTLNGPETGVHLYGREMDSFHIYDPEAGTRKLVDVAYNES